MEWESESISWGFRVKDKVRLGVGVRLGLWLGFRVRVSD